MFCLLLIAAIPLPKLYEYSIDLGIATWLQATPRAKLSIELLIYATLLQTGADVRPRKIYMTHYACFGRWSALTEKLYVTHSWQINTVAF